MDLQRDRLERALAGQYTIEHELGRGGMAVVYLGRDTRLGRRVAIKVFDRAVSDTATDRFLREIRVTARLQHPSIVPVFEAGEADGLVYYVMPYVAGASLRARLERDGPLPIADAVRIAPDAAEALDHAHRAGLVHRDIKPDNIMLADGVAMVADFGIARVVADAAGSLTGAGLAVGTPNYMSPEQASGSSQVDGRADTYALACVLYEMLTGAPPFAGPTAQAVMARHVTDAPAPLQSLRSVPKALETAIDRALAKVPGDRWPTARAFADALAQTGTTTRPFAARADKPYVRVAAIASVVMVTGVVALLVWRGPATGSAHADRSEGGRSVAVLPFEFSGDSSYADLAEGLTDGVLKGLVQVEGIVVAAVSRAPADRARYLDPREAGRSLKVNNVIWARVQVVKDRLRVSASLIDVADGYVRWQDSFGGNLLVAGQLNDLFLIQDSLTVRMVGALRPRLAPERRTLAARGVRTRNREAYRLYQDAVSIPWLNVNPDSIELRDSLLRRAVELDSGFADAWAELAQTTQGLAATRGGPPREAAAELYRLVAKALVADSAHAQALMLRGRYRWFYDWDWDSALRDVGRAVEIAPGSVVVVEQYLWLLTFSSQHDSALALARRSLDTTSVQSWTNLAHRFNYSGMLDSAIVAAERAHKLNQDAFGPRLVLLFSYRRAGRQMDAERIAEAMRPIALADNPNVISILSDYYELTGNRTGAQEMLDRLVQISRNRWVSPALLAGARLNVGDRMGALADLDEAVRVGDNNLMEWIPSMYWRMQGDPGMERVRRAVFGTRPVPTDPAFPVAASYRSK